MRILVLAADTLETSIAAAPNQTTPAGRSPRRGARPGAGAGAKYQEFRDDLSRIARLRSRDAHAARILLILNHARDHAPITHGSHDNPDTVVADATDQLAAAWPLSPTEKAALPRDVATLVQHAIAAATARKLGYPNQPGNL